MRAHEKLGPSGPREVTILIDVQHMLEHDSLGLLRGGQHEQLAMAA